MPDLFPYSEEVLQWIWEHTFFDLRKLVTSEGKKVEVLHPGKLNPTDGPDFSGASIIIDGIELHGAVEMHLRSTGWKQHGHHRDTSYDQVILHVLAGEITTPTYRTDGSLIPSLNLLPYIKSDALEFLSAVDSGKSIPCSDNVHFISQEALDLQIEKAHALYFEKKVNDLLTFYDPELLPSEAWKQALILAIFDGMGIPHNREAMVQVGKWLLEQGERKSREEILNFAFAESEGTISWNYKEVHPVSHPAKRIIQASDIAYSILDVPFQSLLRSGSLELWEVWMKRAEIKSHYKSQILNATVFYPAMYLLGALYGSEKLKKSAKERWTRYRISIPKSLQKKLNLLKDIEVEEYTRMLGTVHQLRAFCEPRKCHQCEVLKKVISS
jgi:hypothetical protein